MNHFIMGKYQDKILAVRIQHGEGQLAIIVFPEIGIAFHIA